MVRSVRISMATRVVYRCYFHSLDLMAFSSRTVVTRLLVKSWQLKLRGHVKECVDRITGKLALPNSLCRLSTRSCALVDDRPTICRQVTALLDESCASRATIDSETLAQCSISYYL